MASRQDVKRSHISDSEESPHIDEEASVVPDWSGRGPYQLYSLGTPDTHGHG